MFYCSVSSEIGGGQERVQCSDGDFQEDYSGIGWRVVGRAGGQNNLFCDIVSENGKPKNKLRGYQVPEQRKGVTRVHLAINGPARPGPIQVVIIGYCQSAPPTFMICRWWLVEKHQNHHIVKFKNIFSIIYVHEAVKSYSEFLIQTCLTYTVS